MQFGMFRANLAIPGRPVLEVVAVPVFCEPFPLGGHSRRSLHKVVLCPEVAPIIGFVNLPDIVQKAFERFSIAVLIQQGGEGFVQFMERLQA